MSIVRVAAVQFAVSEDVEENLGTCLRMIDQAAAEGAQVVVLPEFGNHVSWYDDRDHARRMALTLEGPFVAALSAKAAEHGIHLMANCTLAREDGRTTGSNILFGPDGAILGVTDKQVLMGSERDHLDGAIAGSPVIDTAFGRVGLYSCMDGVINETPRLLGVGGAQVLLNSLNSFALDEASLHVPVRAVENRVWVVAANKVGPLVPARSIEMVAERVGVPVEMLHGAGESQIVAPDGTVVAVGPRTGEAVVVADIDVVLADDKRRPDGTDVMTSRRPDLYGPIVEAPRGRQRPAGADELVTAVVSPAVGDDVRTLLTEALATPAELVVLPELAGIEPDAIVAALAGSSTLVATSVVEGDTHVGLVLSADGEVLRQPQLHACARHAWVSSLGDGLAVADLPWGRLALVVGDDALYPETFRLAALQDVDVVAVPFTTQTASDLDPLLLERAAENRLNVAVASRRREHGGGALYPLSTDFTLWGPGRGPFAGIISRPDPVIATGAVEVATLRPACAANRFVSKGTDLVDGRPWALAQPLRRWVADSMIEIPSAAGVEQALAVARRWLPAFLEGRRADDDVYADGVTTWHNIGEREAEIQRTPSRTRQVRAGADLRVEDVRLKVFDGGWVLQTTTVGTNPDGDPVRLPTCLVVTLRDGKIARFEEYADSRAAEALFG